MLRGWALGVAQRHADPRDDARDIVQEAFTAALRDWQVFAPDPTRPAFSSLRAWLAGILEKKQLMARRLRRTRGEVPLSTAEKSSTEALRHPGHEAQMEARSTLGALQRATTPERWRAAHAAALGFTAAEIAALEGVKVCTIAWRIREARTDFETVTGEATKRARRSR
jgi:DNA-directed RNA polymerase specialized sigma24 family protein